MPKRLGGIIIDCKYYTVANPARGLLNRGKKKKVWQRLPPQKKKITRCIHITRRCASRRYAGGVGPSRIRTRIPTTRQLGQWVSLRKTLSFRVRLQLSSLVASLFSWRCLAASSSSCLHAAMNLRPPCGTASTQPSAFTAIVFQSPFMPNARMTFKRVLRW